LTPQVKRKEVLLQKEKLLIDPECHCGTAKTFHQYRQELLTYWETVRRGAHHQEGVQSRLREDENSGKRIQHSPAKMMSGQSQSQQSPDTPDRPPHDSTRIHEQTTQSQLDVSIMSMHRSRRILQTTTILDALPAIMVHSGRESTIEPQDHSGQH
ncbi:hypothetical protein PV326_008656, partial [Microctonus aethiopoides]